MRHLVLCVALLSACKASDPKDPQTFVKKLSDSDPKTRQKAVQELRKLKAREAAAPVAALLRDPLVKEDAALALQEMGGPAEVPALLEAVDTTVGAGSDQATRVANRTNAKIAEALGNIGDAKAGPTLLRLARASDDLVRLSAVQALGQVKFADGVGELSHIVDDPAAPPILIKKAIISLGQIGDARAIPALEHGLVLERQGVSFLPESSFALFLLGKDAVEPLLKLAQDQDPAWLAWAKEQNRAPAGTYAKAALVLGDLEDLRAVPALLKKLKYEDPDPVPGTSHLLSNLVREFSANALGRMRVKEAAGPIQQLVTVKDPVDEDVVSFACEALVWIGDKAQARELLKKAAQPGALKLRLSAAQSAAQLGEPALVKDLSAIAAKESKGQGAACQKQLAEANLPADDPKTACEALGAQFGQLAAAFEAAKACNDNAACWTGRLATDKDPWVRARAAYELGRAGAAEAVPPLLKAVSDGELASRAAAIRALDWLAASPAAKEPLRQAAAQLMTQLNAETGRVQFVRVNEDLRRLQVRLSRL